MEHNHLEGGSAVASSRKDGVSFREIDRCGNRNQARSRLRVHLDFGEIGTVGTGGDHEGILGITFNQYLERDLQRFSAANHDGVARLPAEGDMDRNIPGDLQRILAPLDQTDHVRVHDSVLEDADALHFLVRS